MEEKYSRAMTPRERVRTAVDLKEPDRVPMAFGGSYYGPHDQLYLQILDVLGLPLEPEWQFRLNKGHTVNYHDDRILDALGTDVRYIWMGSTDINSPDFSQVTPDKAAEANDLYGVGFRKTGYQVQVVPGRFPIHGGDVENYDMSAVDNFVFPDVDAISRVDEMNARAKHLAENTDYAVAVRAANSFGLFEQGCHLIGHEDYYLAMALNKPLVHLLTERIKEFFLELYDKVLTDAGPYIDVIELPGDDYSGTGMSMVSGEMFYEFFIDPWKEIYALMREKAPNAKILFHCDGVIMDFMQPFIDVGSDIVNSIETGVGNDLAVMKSEYGDRVALWGALDIKVPMQQSKDAVERDIDEKMSILKPGGGWVFCNENHVMPDVPPANLFYAYEYAAKVGVY